MEFGSKVSKKVQNLTKCVVNNSIITLNLVIIILSLEHEFRA
jgi:hypothetical protein